MLAVFMVHRVDDITGMCLSGMSRLAPGLAQYGFTLGFFHLLERVGFLFLLGYTYGYLIDILHNIVS